MRDAVDLGTAEGAAAAQTLYEENVRLSLSFKTGGPLTHADVALTNAGSRAVPLGSVTRSKHPLVRGAARSPGHPPPRFSPRRKSFRHVACAG